MQFDAKISGVWATVPAKQWAKLVDVSIAAEKCSQTIKEDDWPEMTALNKALAEMSICDEAPDCETARRLAEGKGAYDRGDGAQYGDGYNDAWAEVAGLLGLPKDFFEQDE